MAICIAENSGGQGGVAGGGGAHGQASLSAQGHAATSYGWPVIEAVTGTPCTVDVQLTKDYHGEIPQDLSDMHKVLFVAWSSMERTRPEIVIDCSFTSTGKVAIPFTRKELDFNNGLWYAEFRCSKGKVLMPGDPGEEYWRKVIDENAPLDSERLWDIVTGGDQSDKPDLLYLDPGDTYNHRAWLLIRKGTRGSRGGPRTLTALDVRMAMMDTSPDANELLQDLEFSDSQIYHAVQRCIDEYNEIPPRLDHLWTSTTFPWTEHLLKGVIGYLMQEAAYKYTRNRMQYSASGFTTDNNDKGDRYVQLAQMARHEWKEFMYSKKTEENMAAVWGTVTNPWF